MKLGNPYPLRLSIPMEKEQRKHLLALNTSSRVLVFDPTKVTKFRINRFQINTFIEGGQSRPEITKLLMVISFAYGSPWHKGMMEVITTFLPNPK